MDPLCIRHIRNSGGGNRND